MIYVFKNLKTLFARNRFIAALLLMVEISSVLVILFSFGTYGNYKTLKDDTEKEGVYVNFYSEGQATDGSEEPNGFITVDEFRMLLDSLSAESKEALSGFWFDLNCGKYYNFTSVDYYDKAPNGNAYTDGDYIFMCRLEYHPESDSYGMPVETVKNMAITGGRYFADDDEYMDSNYIVIPSGSNADFLGKTIEFLGSEYEVIGIDGEPEVTVPFDTLDGGLTISYFGLISEDKLTKPAYDELKKSIHEISGGREEMTDSSIIDFSEIKYYNSIIIVTVAIAVIAAVNLAILYAYILSQRQATTGIMMICGCSRLKARAICCTEIFLLSTVLFAVCALVYHNFLLAGIIKKFNYIIEVYSLKNYLMIYAYYIIAILLFANITISVNISKSPVRMLAERRK